VVGFVLLAPTVNGVSVICRSSALVFFYEFVPIRANIAHVLAIPNLYLTHFVKIPPLLGFSRASRVVVTLIYSS
jgi:hypothetical protein